MRLLIAGGGTGAHLYPALAVARAVRAEEPDGALLLVGRRGGPEERLGPARRAAPGRANARGGAPGRRRQTVRSARIAPPARRAYRRTLEPLRPAARLRTG